MDGGDPAPTPLPPLQLFGADICPTVVWLYLFCLLFIEFCSFAFYRWLFFWDSFFSPDSSFIRAIISWIGHFPKLPLSFIWLILQGSAFLMEIFLNHRHPVICFHRTLCLCFLTLNHNYSYIICVVLVCLPYQAKAPRKQQSFLFYSLIDQPSACGLLSCLTAPVFPAESGLGK